MPFPQRSSQASSSGRRPLGGAGSVWTCALLLALTSLASVGRWQSASRLFSPSSPIAGVISGDELAYMFLGDRLVHGRAYSTIGLEQLLPAEGAHPAYLRAPLFKHPPLYPLLVGLSRAVFSGWPGAAFYPSLLFGAGMIIVVFILARALDLSVGLSLLAAVFVAASPVVWVCSSRVWMDIALAFFVSSALVAQAIAAKDERWFVLAGLAWGCAMLTKYPAGAGWLAVVVSGLLTPGTRRSKSFWAGHGLAFALIGTWLAIRVGLEGHTAVYFWRSDVQDWRAFGRMLRWVWVAPLLFAAVVASRRWLAGHPQSCSAAAAITSATVTFIAGAGMGAWPIWTALPWSGWGHNELMSSGWTFYLVHPVAFDPVLWLGLFGLLAARRDRHFDSLVWVWLGLFSFNTLWGNYQSRYGVALLPLQVVLAVLVVKDTVQQRHGSIPWGSLLATLWVLMSLGRSLWVDWSLAASNDFFYF